MNTALIIIDIQNDYFEDGNLPLVGAEEASLNAQKILYSFRKNKMPIAHVKHFTLDKTKNYLLPNTKGSEIHKSVEPINGEKVITKFFPNSFRRTDLLNYLEDNKIKNLVVCGMMTHMCVDATTRAAKDLGFEITLIGDACATRDLAINNKIIKAEDVHNSFLAALNGFYSVVKFADEYLK